MPARLYQLAEQALTAVVAHYAAEGVDLPDRRLVSVGQAPWDCDLLNVWVLRDYPAAGSPGAEVLESIRRSPAHYMRAATLGLQLARCYPASDDGVTPPDVAAEEAAAELIYSDADLLWRALLAANTAGTFSQANGVAYEGWAGIGPSGAMAGGVLTVRALLP